MTEDIHAVNNAQDARLNESISDDVLSQVSGGAASVKEKYESPQWVKDGLGTRITCIDCSKGEAYYLIGDDARSAGYSGLTKNFYYFCPACGRKRAY